MREHGTYCADFPYLRPISLPTNIVGFGGFDSINLKGWNSQAHRGFPGKFESSNVSRDNVSREIGRTLFYRPEAANLGDCRFETCTTGRITITITITITIKTIILIIATIASINNN